MIRNIAEMLDQFLAFEMRELDRQRISHGPTIGAMYEGLTRSALTRSLPNDLGLAVVSGFAEGAGGALSRQLDCMLVVGDGRTIPHTDAKVYPIDRILAVVEVKKSLYTEDVGTGRDNLKSVVQLGNEPTVYRSTIRRAFQSISRCPLPEDHHELPEYLAMLYHALVVDATVPVRILLGYHGFAGEPQLRAGMARHLGEVVGVKGYGIVSLPSLILNQQAAAIKMNGMPWPGVMEDRWWPVVATSSFHSPAGLFLETIFSRLNDRRLIDASWFGEDLELEAWNRLVDARFDEAKRGWEFRLASLEAAGLSDGPRAREWSPAFLTESQFVLMNLLCNESEVDLDEIALNSADRSMREADVRVLEAAGLAGRHVGRPHMISALTDNCRCGILPDGRFFAGEDSTGRLGRWVMAYMEKYRQGG